MERYLFFLWAVWNFAVFLLYGLDKYSAQRGKRRIRERTLLWSAFFAGGVGAILGMVVWNHKTSKKRFRFAVPAAFLWTAGLLFFFLRTACGGVMFAGGKNLLSFCRNLPKGIAISAFLC